MPSVTVLFYISHPSGTSELPGSCDSGSTWQELGATCSLGPGGVPQVCITELWSVGSQRGGGGVTGSRSQSPVPPTASSSANFNLQLPQFSGSHSKRYEVTFCNVSAMFPSPQAIRKTFTHKVPLNPDICCFLN